MDGMGARAQSGDCASSPKRSMQIKTYLVFLPNNVAKEGEANRRVLSVKLTRKAAERVRDAYPGAYIERHVADKL